MYWYNSHISFVPNGCFLKSIKDCIENGEMVTFLLKNLKNVLIFIGTYPVNKTNMDRQANIGYIYC